MTDQNTTTPAADRPGPDERTYDFGGHARLPGVTVPAELQPHMRPAAWVPPGQGVAEVPADPEPEPEPEPAPEPAAAKPAAREPAAEPVEVGFARAYLPAGNFSRKP